MGGGVGMALFAHRRLWLNARSMQPVELGFQTAFKVAHRMLRAYWFVRRPQTHGALVAVWHQGQLLLVKNSYRRHYTLPGGYIRDGETPVQAAARELGEEVGIHVPPEAVRQAMSAIKEFENRHDHVTLCEVELDERPTVQVDNREVVWAGFLSPQEILAKPIVPHLVQYLSCRP